MKKQNGLYGRRSFLLQSTGLLVALSGTSKAADPSTDGRGRNTPSVDLKSHGYGGPPPHGATYAPARSYNGYQTWCDYDPKVTRRDVQYAHSLRINAFRLWLSFEFWLQDREALSARFDDFLHQCDAQGIKVMPDLFESDGIDPTPANLADTNPLTAAAIKSPSGKIVRDRRLWKQPMEYVEWFMHHFGNDRRLLAIEIDNEPWEGPRMIFAREMMRHAAGRRGSVPLTIGGNSTEQSLYFLDVGIDILQTHCNFPATAQVLRQRIHQQIIVPQKMLGKPVWMTEWQRLRPHGSGWGNKPIYGMEWEPDYVSMAPVIKSYGIGNFFWSLMLKPAWLLIQRKKGTLSGVFHEDGAVWSLADARAISGNPHFQATVRKAWPQWARPIPESVGIPVTLSS
ncbi:MAG: glycoside hydrolase [Phycisphaerae bacterium]